MKIGLLKKNTDFLQKIGLAGTLWNSLNPWFFMIMIANNFIVSWNKIYVPIIYISVNQLKRSLTFQDTNFMTSGKESLQHFPSVGVLWRMQATTALVQHTWFLPAWLAGEEMVLLHTVSMVEPAWQNPSVPLRLVSVHCTLYNVNFVILLV